MYGPTVVQTTRVSSAIARRLSGSVASPMTIGASLTVVGSRGQSRLHRLLLGSLSADLVARANALTFYDASYLAVAQRADLTLVTEDDALRDAATDRAIPATRVQSRE
ncbi:type II toxin-antitoxin system VapC family toxin [Salinadaptatus halalkaliphilus]|uniref:type II toxin-antitoxin system VapC family toxin n=1 Tax=Salinadaptatus halalkaliphilus TaxID=2419781 RepID=UPI001FE303C3|nr:type II toxin-antitoxin system VapC family toxin [Salinadaptatus halalkaliphilus]